jgi:hypothetical protein
MTTTRFDVGAWSAVWWVLGVIALALVMWSLVAWNAY